MQNKDINTNGNLKINRYNQIDLIGSYGMKDNFNIGAPAKKDEKEDVISVLIWMLLIVVALIPIVNVVTFLVMCFVNINRTMKNFAKAALIIIFALLLLFLYYL